MIYFSCKKKEEKTSKKMQIRKEEKTMTTVVKKERMVTRTINKNTVTVFGANFDTMTFEERTKVITGKLDKWENELYILQQFATENFAPKAIKDFRTEEVKIGMSESDFIKYGHVLTESEESED